MRNISKFIIGIGCLASVSVSMTGCIDETFPTDVATDEQLTSSSKATEALLWAMPAFLNKYDVLGQDPSAPGYDWGYGSIMHIRDVMTEDMPVVSSGYDHYSAWEGNQYIGPRYMSTQFIWNYFWKYVQTSNNIIKALDPETADAT